MSWSISFTGKSEEVVKQLQEHSTTLTDQSKAEYDAALPYMVGLARLNAGNPTRQIKIDGWGHGYKGGFEREVTECSVSIKENDPLI